MTDLNMPILDSEHKQEASHPKVNSLFLYSSYFVVKTFWQTYMCAGKFWEIFEIHVMFYCNRRLM